MVNGVSPRLEISQCPYLFENFRNFCIAVRSSCGMLMTNTFTLDKIFLIASLVDRCDELFIKNSVRLLKVSVDSVKR